MRKYDVFICHSLADQAWVYGYLLPALGLPSERLITLQAFQPGAPVVTEFERAITNSRYTVLVLTPAYLADEWSTFSEQLISHASVADQRDRLIPLLLQPCTLPLRLNFRVHLDCTGEVNWEVEMARLRALLAQPEPTLEPLPCPYPGMVPFSLEDTHYFYGREKEIDELLRRLRYQNYLFVIGPSGSGKSSLIFAGFLAALNKQQGHWLVKSMRPGANPKQTLLEILAGSLAGPAESVADYVELIKAALAKNPPSQRLLLIIDQFEELFTQTPKPDRLTFIAAIKLLQQVPNCAIILALRADFYPDLMNSDLWPVSPGQRLEIAPLRGLALREAIAKPAKSLEVYLEVGLLERLLADAANEPGVLPLIQETMALLWEKMTRRLLSLNAYDQLGGEAHNGLAVALASKADATLAELSPIQQAVARRIFLRLVQFGEGRANTRRQQPVAALQSSSDHLPLFEQTLRHLADNRLLTLSGEAEGAGRKVDIAHEILIETWPALQRWLVERGEAEQSRRRLEAKAAEWVRLGQAGGGLLDAAELAEAEQWLAGLDAADLGYSSIVQSLAAASRAAINPGWHRWGTPGLIVSGVGLAALLGLLYLETQGLANVLRITLWIFAGVLISLALFASGLLRRTTPYRGQRLSHAVARRRPVQLGIGLLSIGAIGLWAFVGVQSVQTTAYCNEQGYQKIDNLIHIAVSTSGVDPYNAKIVSDVLSSYEHQIKSWVVSPADALRCTAFFNYRLELEEFPLAASHEISYFANLEPPAPGNEPAPQVIRSQEECSLFVELAHKVVGRMGIQPSKVYSEKFDLPPLVKCQPFMLTEEGFRDYKQWKFEEAELKLRQAIEFEPDYPTAYYYLGLVYLAGERYPQAIESFEQAVALLPNYAPFLNELGKACYRGGAYECAEQNYRAAIQAVELSQEDQTYVKAEAYGNLFTLYRRLGNDPEVEAALEQEMALLSSPKDDGSYYRVASQMYMNRGLLAFDRGRWPEAIEALEHADSLHPYFEEEIVYYLAVSYEKMGNTETACQYWQRYDKAQPNRSVPPDFRLLSESERRADAERRSRTLNCTP